MAWSAAAGAEVALVVEGVHAALPLRGNGESGGADGGDDVGVGSAATDVAGHALADFVVGELRVIGVAGAEADDGELTLFALVNGGDGGADLAWGAVTALESVMFEKGLLYRMKVFTVGKAFDGGDLRAFGGEGEGEAGVDAAAVDEDGAGAALAVIATLLAAGHIEVFAQRVQEGGAGCRA